MATCPNCKSENAVFTMFMFGGSLKCPDCGKTNAKAFEPEMFEGKT